MMPLLYISHQGGSFVKNGGEKPQSPSPQIIYLFIVHLPFNIPVSNFLFIKPVLKSIFDLSFVKPCYILPLQRSWNRMQTKCQCLHSRILRYRSPMEANAVLLYHWLFLATKIANQSILPIRNIIRVTRLYRLLFFPFFQTEIVKLQTIRVDRALLLKRLFSLLI